MPSWRPDLVGMADIAEEVGRLFGYNNIPTTTFRGAATEGGYTEAMKLENRAGSLCRSLGYSEILTYSFVSPSIFDQIRLPEDSSLRNAMRIQNPLGEDASIMRTVALPSMLAILARNNAYHNDAVKLYELAKVYLPKPGQTLPDEPKHLVLGTYGEHEDFFKMKGEIEAFLRGMNVPEARYTAEKHDPTFHPGRCARVSVGGVDLGCFGQIHPLVARSYGIDGEIFAAELNFTALLSLQLPEKTYTPLPKYPAVTRDIAVVCDEAVTVARPVRLHPRRRRQAAAQRGAVRYLPRQGHRFRLEERGLPPDAPCRRPHADGCRFRRRRVRRSGRSGKRAERQAPLSTVLFPICLLHFSFTLSRISDMIEERKKGGGRNWIITRSNSACRSTTVRR